jgi:hypothetical protein
MNGEPKLTLRIAISPNAARIATTRRISVIPEQDALAGGAVTAIERRDRDASDRHVP